MARYVNSSPKHKPKPPKPPEVAQITPYQLANSPEAKRAMEARLHAARQFTATVEDGRANYADMLSRMWKTASETLASLEADKTMPLTKRIEAMQKLAKVMPMLARAEKAHVATIGGIAVEDMSQAQLEAAVTEITGR